MFPGVQEMPLQFIVVTSLSNKRYSYDWWLLVITKSGKEERKIISLTVCKLKCFSSQIQATPPPSPIYVLQLFVNQAVTS